MFEFLKLHQINIMLALSATCFTFGILMFITRFLDKRRRLILILMEFIAAFLLYFDRMAYLYSGDLSNTGIIMTRVSNFVVFFLTSAVVYGFNLYLMDLLRVEGKQTVIPKRLIFVSYASLFGMALVVISQFTGFIYYFDANNVYHRGIGFFLNYVTPLVCPLIQYTVVVNYRKVFSKFIYTALVLFIFVPIITGVIQYFAYGISIVNMAIVFVSMTLYIFSYLDINETVLRAHRLEMKELQEEKKSMLRLFDETANAFVVAIEKRNPFFDGYSKRTADFALRIAKAVGKNDEECDEIYYSALLHDVGIASIPIEILSKKPEDLTDDDRKTFQKIPDISRDILSRIKEYPYLSDNAIYSHERYDGSGFPKGLKGDEIPEIARIIAVADAYNFMSSSNGYRGPYPYFTIREEFIKQAGITYDAKFAAAMVDIMDRDFAEGSEDKLVQFEKELKCDQFRDSVSTGIPLKQDLTRIRFKSFPLVIKGRKFSDPYILLFDSFDGHVHYDPRAIKAYFYTEYSEIWFDGHFNSIGARNMEVGSMEKNDSSDNVGKVVGMGESFEIVAGRYEDHIKIEMKSSKGKFDAIIALDDNSKSAFIGLTGENCYIKDIEVVETNQRIAADDIKKIADKVSYIDRMVSDLPNVQIDQPIAFGTQAVLVEDGLRIDFHSMSLPASALVWQCPYIVLFYSDDKKLWGENYKGYAMIKINGEVSGQKGLSENNFSMKRLDTFPGWDQWKEKNKEGIECSVRFAKRGNKITVYTENLGVEIENTTTILDGSKDVYVSITGDQVALTDIRVR
ncbi:HD-GYP domain-containing protein [Butyrivibrio proteoclasticus]|uniref:HD-GYP domain-containing protein n=1 Tax=Butyrivibrio proteoclasticus TaxID=43305 RepID=UPI00047BDCEE|nr:HD domain-containing phosphohydrolase [Butyrivibrio proteoclasticus]